MKFHVTSSFEKSVKDLKRKHQKKELNDLLEIVTLINNQELTTQHHNHPLEDANGLYEAHLGTGKYVILWRYDVTTDTLIISARLQDVADHDVLTSKSGKVKKNLFKDSPTKELEYDEVKKVIEDSYKISSKDNDVANDEEFIDYVDDLYDNIISVFIPVDNFECNKVIDKGNYLIVECSGYQYEWSIKRTEFKNKALELKNALVNEGLDNISILKNENTDYYTRDNDCYKVLFRFNIPLEYI